MCYHDDCKTNSLGANRPRKEHKRKFQFATKLSESVNNMFNLSWGTVSKEFNNFFDCQSQEFDNVYALVEKVVELVKSGIDPETMFATSKFDVLE